ncbi:hypothetical protein TVAG_407560 [Trichomonas vaginalis G3]|uniref:DUF3447 domain-containing protein n=1 Tax=Trichomonas vaginalis (strain ATCC PRA-98 / G3) TaxID=412133 RepID=A2F198_TRIV3|nr:Ankyrin repeat family [Trichomonas vaginalis G3]EAY01327.1 hypothetical protein TVAG_407560 [Trichomonas vaginalis G3]KAI5506814.1 Ankyrin repeat family [Trichomonas vaginalis G3]|eukprot:XP_001330185.1 hypothetical protein [Trichomonas vaginalis G3]
MNILSKYDIKYYEDLLSSIDLKQRNKDFTPFKVDYKYPIQNTIRYCIAKDNIDLLDFINYYLNDNTVLEEAIKQKNKEISKRYVSEFTKSDADKTLCLNQAVLSNLIEIFIELLQTVDTVPFNTLVLAIRLRRVEMVKIISQHKHNIIPGNILPFTNPLLFEIIYYYNEEIVEILKNEITDFNIKSNTDSVLQ